MQTLYIHNELCNETNVSILYKSLAYNAGQYFHILQQNENHMHQESMEQMEQLHNHQKYAMEVENSNGTRIYPCCGATVPDSELFCGECGQKL